MFNRVDKREPSIIVRNHAIMSMPELRALIARTGAKKIYVNQLDFNYLWERSDPTRQNDKGLIVDGCQITARNKRVLDFSDFNRMM